MLKILIIAVALTTSCTASALAQPDTPPPAAQGPDGAPAHGFDPAMHTRMDQMRQACTADALRLCATTLADRHARRECIMANEARLSPGCRDAMAQMRAWRQAHPHGPPHDGGGGAGVP